MMRVRVGESINEQQKRTSHTPNSLTKILLGNLLASIWLIMNTFEVNALSSIIGMLLV
jgi:hypothetical protein